MLLHCHSFHFPYQVKLLTDILPISSQTLILTQGLDFFVIRGNKSKLQTSDQSQGCECDISTLKNVAQRTSWSQR